MTTAITVSAAPSVQTSTDHGDTSNRRRTTLKPSTILAYDKAMRHYYGVFRGSMPCDRADAERYVASMRKNAAATAYLRLQALRHEHVRLGHSSPTDAPELRALMRNLQLGIMPGRSGATPKRKEPRAASAITRSLLLRVLDVMGRNSRDRRDRALLLLGFMGALSPSAMSALDAADVSFADDAMILRVRESTEAGAAKRSVSVPRTGGDLCAAKAVADWMQYAQLDLTGGPLLRRHDRAGNPTSHRIAPAYFSVIVKARVRASGAEPTNFSGLSLRNGKIRESARGVL
jgi:integrase